MAIEEEEASAKQNDAAGISTSQVDPSPQEVPHSLSLLNSVMGFVMLCMFLSCL